MNHYFYLCFAIFAEVIATTLIPRTEQFTKLGPSLLVIAGYIVAFYSLSIVTQVLPVGIVYAVWAGSGILFVSVLAWLWYGQTLDTPAITGMTLIVAGVAVINLFSKSTAH